ncbi:glycosyltransferase [Paenibacillus sp. TAF58]
MLVSNHVTSDPRVTKEAKDLTREWTVKVIGIQSVNNPLPSQENVDGYIVLRTSAADIDIKHKYQKLYAKLSGLIKISWLALKQKPDVYHAHDFDMLPFAYVAAKLNKAKLVYDSHELWIEQRSDFPRWFKWLVRKVEGFLIRRANLVITVNESIANELSSRYNLQSSPIILHNFSVLDKLNAQSLSQSNTHQKIVVLYHGGYMKDRGLEELIQAVHFLPENVVVHFRGLGPIEKELKEEAEPLIKQGRVVFVPPVPMLELISSAGSADIGIIPYKPTCLNNFYSLPNKLSEYAMAGLAICASNLPEISKINDKIHFGHLFDSYSPRSIADAIIATCESRSQLNQHKENSKSWAQLQGNWQNESVKLLAGYKSLLGE